MGDEREIARKIMYNQQSRKRESLTYQVIAAEACEDLAARMEATYPDRFTFHKTRWDKFPDGTDDIEVGGFHPTNLISGERVLFLASFHSNDVTLSQFQVMICLLQSFVEEMVVVLPYSPVGTMERVVREGQVATAATHAHLFSSLPDCGKPTRLMVYDLHTLQNRFYLHGNAVASLQTAIPLLKRRIAESRSNGGGGGGGNSNSNSNSTGVRGAGDDGEGNSGKGTGGIDCVAFPDDGAAKRFSTYFDDVEGLEVIVCGKTRGDGDERIVTIQSGNPRGRNVVIVDDLVQTGGTLYETGKVLKASGAASVNAYCSHAVFPNQSWRRFNRGGDRACFDKFWVTNSIPTVTDVLPIEDGVFEVLDLMDLIINDLDHFHTNAWGHFNKRANIGGGGAAR